MTAQIRSMTLVLVAGLLVVTGGCAKRPAMPGASAPAPMGAAAQATTPKPAGEPTLSAAQPSAPAPGAVTPVTPSAPARSPAPAPPSEYAASDALKPIHFDFDKSDIRKADAEILRANARWLSDNPRQIVLIEGHCDERGTNEYNLALGERRARAAMNFLVAQGVAAGRITVISYGEERPLCSQGTEACWARNRRAMFLTKPQ